MIVDFTGDDMNSIQIALVQVHVAEKNLEEKVKQYFAGFNARAIRIQSFETHQTRWMVSLDNQAILISLDQNGKFSHTCRCSSCIYWWEGSESEFYYALGLNPDSGWVIRNDSQGRMRPDFDGRKFDYEIEHPDTLRTRLRKSDPSMWRGEQ